MKHDLDKLKSIIKQIKISQRSQHITIRKALEEIVNLMENVDSPEIELVEDTISIPEEKSSMEKAEEIRKKYTDKKEGE